jgi:hypothetical protein
MKRDFQSFGKDEKFSSAIGPIKKPVFGKVVAKIISYLKKRKFEKY